MVPIVQKVRVRCIKTISMKLIELLQINLQVCILLHSTPGYDDPIAGFSTQNQVGWGNHADFAQFLQRCHIIPGFLEDIPKLKGDRMVETGQNFH
jgi:hypothetical protein